MHVSLCYFVYKIYLPHWPLYNALNHHPCCVVFSTALYSRIFSSVFTFLFLQSPPNNFFFWKMVKENYWIFSQISFFIWKSNPSFQKLPRLTIQLATRSIQFLSTFSIVCSWLHEYCPLKRQLSLACRLNTYLWRHPTNNNQTISDISKLEKLIPQLGSSLAVQR